MSSGAVMDEQRPNENWPEKDFLETILRTWLEDPKVKVQEFTSRIATSKGDNYTSDMFRVTVKCEQMEEPLHIIIKRRIKVDYDAYSNLLTRLFKKEEMIFKNILPEMVAVLKEAVPDEEPIGAGYVYSTPGVLVMEDLQQGGFRMAQRRAGLDLNHCSLVVRTLARYHAASIFLMERKSVDFSEFQKSYYAEPNEMLENFCNGTLRLLSEKVKSFEGLEKYATKLAAFAEVSPQKRLKDVTELHEDGDLRVLSHGDLWVNNIMFRYSPSGEPDGVRFVDFQLSCITSPCIDLQHFLTTSSNEIVRTTSIDHLLKKYHETLCKTMAALECFSPPPTFEKLKEDFDKRTQFGMFSALTAMPVVFAEPGQFDLSDIEEGANVKDGLYSSKSYQKALEWFLPLFESKGYL